MSVSKLHLLCALLSVVLAVPVGIFAQQLTAHTMHLANGRTLALNLPSNFAFDINSKQQAFLDFVLSHYFYQGVGELARTSCRRC